MQHIHHALMALEAGPAQRFGRLTMVPLMAPGEAAAANEPDYLTLPDALAREQARVTEVSEQGQVPELAFENLARDRDVLLLDGEELVGAKQNRILNLTILVAAGARVKIPVSCVEQGRWSRMSEAFRTSDRALFADARAAKMRQVNHSLRTRGSRQADQGDVWRRVAEKAEALNVESRTGAMNDVFESRDGELQQYARAFHALPRQVGAVFIVDEGGGLRPGAPPLAGLELFDAAPTFARTLPKLVGTFALEALVRGGGIAVAPASAGDETRQAAYAGHLAAQLVADVARAVPDRFKALGEGEDLRITRPDLVGGGLVARGRLVHLAAYRHAIRAEVGRGPVH
jgi:hypothetical protein